MLARITEGNEVAEYRDIDISEIPAHKRWLWRPVEVQGSGPLETVSVEPTKVVITRRTPEASQASVTAERTRRLALGFNYNFGDNRGTHHIGTTEQDMKGWDEVTAACQAAIALGQSDMNFSLVTNTGPVVVTASEWQQILLYAAQQRQPIWAASFALQAQEIIPADFAADGHWPG